MSDQQYRYRLTRDLRVGVGKAVWCMLNPSTADQKTDDLTITKVKEFSRRLGVRHIEVVNLYPMRATDPRELFGMTDSTGWQLRNRRTVQLAVQSADHVVFAWGAFWRQHYDKLPLATNIIGETFRARKTPVCLGTTIRGEPLHPGRIGYDREFVPWP